MLSAKVPAGTHGPCPQEAHTLGTGIALQPLSQNGVLEPPDQIALLKSSGGIDIGARAALG